MMESTCEQIIKYDCGHLRRRIIPCAKQPPPKRRHSVTCFLGIPPSYQDRYNENAALFERRATLCQMCEAHGKDGEIYLNSTRRVSAPPIRANQYPEWSHGNEEHTAAKVSAACSIRRSNSNPRRLPSQRLRRVRETGDGSLRNEYTRLELLRNEALEVHRSQRFRPGDIATQGPELDCFASGYVPLSERTPMSATSFTALLDHGQRGRGSSLPSTGGLSRSDSMLTRLQRSLYLQEQSSDESFVCSTAREIERRER